MTLRFTFPAACLASGNFVLCFPHESKVAMDSLYPMFYRNLSDSIPSVRQGAASALCNVVRAYGEDALQNVKSHIIEGLQVLDNIPVLNLLKLISLAVFLCH